MLCIDAKAFTHTDKHTDIHVHTDTRTILALFVAQMGIHLD